VILTRFIALRALDLLRPFAWLALRLYLGWFLIVGVWDNISSPERMAEFEGFLRGLNCPSPEIAAPVSVWAQLAIGVLLIPGLFTRLAGLLLMANFAVAVVLFIGAGMNERQIYEPGILIFVGALLATHGAGSLSLDRLLLRD
jgi:putative oxidoreductase